MPSCHAISASHIDTPLFIIIAAVHYYAAGLFISQTLLRRHYYAMIRRAIALRH